MSQPSCWGSTGTVRRVRRFTGVQLCTNMPNVRTSRGAHACNRENASDAAALSTRYHQNICFSSQHSQIKSCRALKNTRCDSRNMAEVVAKHQSVPTVFDSLIYGLRCCASTACISCWELMASATNPLNGSLLDLCGGGCIASLLRSSRQLHAMVLTLRSNVNNVNLEQLLLQKPSLLHSQRWPQFHTKAHVSFGSVTCFRL